MARIRSEGRGDRPDLPSSAIVFIRFIGLVNQYNPEAGSCISLQTRGRGPLPARQIQCGSKQLTDYEVSHVMHWVKLRGVCCEYFFGFGAYGAAVRG
jgi:hypothetical protein